jgi:hypothetical protein
VQVLCICKYIKFLRHFCPIDFVGQIIIFPMFKGEEKSRKLIIVDEQSVMSYSNLLAL